jgi:hypothetical protein
MKVAVFTTHIHWPSHYETELEIIQKHLNEGDEVVQLVCNADLPTCDINITHDLENCMYCIGKRKFGVSLLSKKIKERSFLKLTSKDKHELTTIKTNFSSIQELQTYKIDNFDIGYAVASSVISLLRNANPDLQANSILIYDYIVSALTVYRSIQNFLKQTAIHRLYVFNGRLAHVKAALRACQSLQVECFIHERGHNMYHYELFQNTLPHDIKYTQDKMLKAWHKQKDIEKRNKLAEDFYLNRVKGVDQGWFSFITTQKEGLMPQEWDVTKKNLVIFNSSEDEYLSIGEEWKYTIYQNQLEGIRQIVASMQLYAEQYHIYVRVHPNLKNVNNTELYSIQASNLTIIPADSPVSTYSLLRYADKVISFGSTVGIEANYWDKPSILLGNSFYMNLGGTYNPDSHQEVIKLLLMNLAPKSKEASLIYGYYLNTYGIAFTYYQPETLGKGKFKSEYIRPTDTYKRLIDKINSTQIWHRYKFQAYLYHRKFVRKIKMGL